jgi:hypothetical protein
MPLSNKLYDTIAVAQPLGRNSPACLPACLPDLASRS